VPPSITLVFRNRSGRSVRRQCIPASVEKKAPRSVAAQSVPCRPAVTFSTLRRSPCARRCQLRPPSRETATPPPPDARNESTVSRHSQRLDAIWCENRAVTCSHPGIPMIRALPENARSYVKGGGGVRILHEKHVEGSALAASTTLPCNWYASASSVTLPPAGAIWSLCCNALLLRMVTLYSSRFCRGSGSAV
jgi:hypothetical protein